MGPSRMIRYSCILAALAAMFLPQGNANATHYPDGANCYDCHTVSKSKMVPNTHLIRESQRTTDLGMLSTSPDVRCLFCHDDAAVPGVAQTGGAGVHMKSVNEHFGSAYMSKHRANPQSSFVNNDGTTLHCLDCHAGIVNGVQYVPAAGNANVHGVDASSTTHLDVYSTLVSDTTVPSGSGEVSAKTCSFSGCHGVTGSNYVDFGDRRAYAQHTYNNLTANDGAVITACTDCHGAHGSQFGVKNLVLLNTSGANGQPATNMPVQLNECDVCHTNDESGGFNDAFMQFGHGKVGIMCDSCHTTAHIDATDPNYHFFSAAPRLKANLAEDTSLTSTFGTYFYSNCAKCHGGHNTHEIPGQPRIAGCRDCHDQHGKMAVDSVFQNDTMIRRMIGPAGSQEATRLPIDSIRYNGDWFLYGATWGVCDNTACHTDITTSLGNAGQHLGGDMTPTTCATGVGCHARHQDTPFGSASGDCATCHASYGMVHDDAATNSPPRQNATLHQQHIDSGYITDCSLCHPHSGPGTLGDSVHNDGIVNFGGTRLASGVTTLDYDRTVKTAIFTDCSALNACHDADPDEWGAGDLGADKCLDCHGSGSKLLGNQTGGGLPGAFPPTTNKHANHLASAAMPSLATDPEKCFICHAGTVDSGGAFVAAGKHLDGIVGDFQFDATYAGYENLTPARTGTGTTSVCSNVKCHNGVTTPTWGTVTPIACGDCHNTGKVGPLPSQASIAGSHAAHADNNADYADCEKCHPNATFYTAAGGHADHQNLAVEITPTTGAYSEVNSGGGVNYSLALPGDGTDNGTCASTSCHGAGSPTWGAAGSVSCGSCHGDVARVVSGVYQDPTTAPRGAPPVDLDTDPLNNDFTTGKHLFHLDESYTQTLAYYGVGFGSSCGLCHMGAGSGSGKHADGTVDIVLDPAIAGASATFTDGVTPTVTGTCTNLACHQDADWDVNFVGGCNFCHGYPPTDSFDAANNHHVGVTAVPHVTASSGVTVAQFLTAHDDCQVCHGTMDNGSGQHSPAAGYNPVANHRNDNITMSGDLGYDESTTFGCSAACHVDNLQHQLSDSGLTVEYIDGLLPSCERCHGISTSPAPQVVWPSGNAPASKTTNYGSHLNGGIAGWNTVCNQCHTGHRGAITVPLPPTSWTNRSNPADATADLVNVNMQTRLGIAYQSLNNMHGGIRLGGTLTTITEEGSAARAAENEAETCWGCHGTNTAINEWGPNVDTNGSFPITGTRNGTVGGSYDYGILYELSSWTTATPAWRTSAYNSVQAGNYRKDSYQHSASNSYALSRRISSIHSVDLTIGLSPGSSVANNVDATGNVRNGDTNQILETRDQIRCSYCHDVHDLNLAVSDASSGRPHLRGTWLGNPYGPDVPPISGYTYPTTGGGKGYGNRKSNSSGTQVFPASNATPRMYPSSSTDLGGYYIDQNSGWPTDPASGNDTLAATAGICTLCHGTDVNNMDYWSNSTTTLWRTSQINGHANSTIEGTGTASGNATNIFDARRGGSQGIFMDVQDQVGTTATNWGNSAKDGITPRSTGPNSSTFSKSSPYSWNSGWYGGTEGANTRAAQYTTWYSASGIGNDGDSRHTNNRAHNFTCSKCHSPHATGLPALLITNCLDPAVGTWSAAGGAAGPGTTNVYGLRVQNNCHRKENTSTGWNKLNVGQ